MRQVTDKLSPPITESSVDESDSSLVAPDPDGEDDPYYYGWRDRWETSTDGTKQLRQVPLTYHDLLDPQLEDFIAENTIHNEMRGDLHDILRRRFEDHPTLAVWSNLKISFRIPGLTTGPGPDVCLVEGVDDRDLLRRSFRYGKEPGKVRLVIEVVSEKSVQKDYKDILVIYERLGVEEYLAIRPLGLYKNGPFELRGWRRHPKTGRLRPYKADAQGRFFLETAGLALATGEDGWDLQVWDGESGELLRPLFEEVEWQAEQIELVEIRATRATERAEQAETALRLADAARQAAEAERQRVEEQNRENLAEIERLRAQLRERDGG